jgi:NDP-sugar pyrophosphorylase family protein
MKEEILNIVIPMAGRGSRFADAGYTTPKPMIPVHGKPMIQVVVENLTPNRPHRFIFICQNEHIKKYNLDTELKSIAANVEVIGIDGITEGMVCTVLKAKDLINNDNPLMTANSDQYIDFDINQYLNEMDQNDADGLIMTMKADDPKWSFAKTDENGIVLKTAEKKVISEDATVGIYNFAKGSDLVKAAEEMIEDDVRVNNEFYVCPCYNYMIQHNKKVVIYGIGEEYNGMYGLGIPQDLEFFLNHPVSEKVK